MDIVIISQYLRDIENLDTNNSRFIYLAKMLSQDNQNQVEIITSDFMHGPKCHAKSIGKCNGYKITAIHEPGYRKNICLTRFYSHAKLAKNIEQYLKKRKKPTCVYCAIPSLDVAYVASKYCRKNNIRFIVDIQDLWPEAFKMVFNIPIVSNLIFAPMKWEANRIYKQADEIIAVSDTYCDCAKKVNQKCLNTHTIFLGTRLETFDQNANTNNSKYIEKKGNKLWLMYCGSLSHSYDLFTVFDALVILRERGEEVPYFIIMGNGDKKKEFEDYSKKKNLNCLFTGKLEYAEMCAILCKGDIMVNPIIKSSPASIINKHGDYAASGHPILNTQVSKEYRSLVDKYQMGFNCKSECPEDLANKMLWLIKDDDLRKKMGQNARKCAEEKFDRKNSYREIYDVIMEKRK